jgi:diaminopimelate epimerase
VRYLADRISASAATSCCWWSAQTPDGVDFRYRIFNADGGEVQQCGNGARCFVRFVFDKGLTGKREIRVETASGIIVPRLEDDGQMTVDMGATAFRAGGHSLRRRGPRHDLRARYRPAGGDRRPVHGQPACRPGDLQRRYGAGRRVGAR